MIKVIIYYYTDTGAYYYSNKPVKDLDCFISVCLNLGCEVRFLCKDGPEVRDLGT